MANQISPWSVFEVESSSTNYSSNYSLSSDLQTLTVSDSGSGNRRLVGFRSICRPGDVLEFEVEARRVSGTMSCLIQVGTFSSAATDAMGVTSRSLKALDADVGDGFRTYHLRTVAPTNGDSLLACLWAVGDVSDQSGEAQFRNPKMFINGTQIGTAGQAVPRCELAGVANNFSTELLSNSLVFTQAMQADGYAGFVGNPFLWNVGSICPGKKIVGTSQRSSTVGLCYFGATGGDDAGGLRILKTGASGPGQFSATPAGGIAFIDAFYDSGSAHKRGGSIRFYRRTSNAAVFSILTPDSSDAEDALGVDIWRDGAFSPKTDNAQKLGGASHRWSTVHAGTGTIQTSDIRAKDNLEAPSEALMRAWGKVNFRVFQMRDAIAEKGADKARLHVGVIAQEVQAAFASEGLDASRYGLFCYDEWEDEYETETVVDVEEHVDAETGEIVPAQTHTERRLVRPAGDLYAIRYEEALALECAYQRWLGEKREARIAALEAKLAGAGE